MAQACNSSLFGRWKQEDTEFKPGSGKIRQALSQKKKNKDKKD
jgi:hypothetical protein